VATAAGATSGAHGDGGATAPDKSIKTGADRKMCSCASVALNLPYRYVMPQVPTNADRR